MIVQWSSSGRPALRSGEEECEVVANNGGGNGGGPERDDDDDLDREEGVCISNTSSESESKSNSGPGIIHFGRSWNVGVVLKDVLRVLIIAAEDKGWMGRHRIRNQRTRKWMRD